MRIRKTIKILKFFPFIGSILNFQMVYYNKKKFSNFSFVKWNLYGFISSVICILFFVLNYYLFIFLMPQIANEIALVVFFIFPLLLLWWPSNYIFHIYFNSMILNEDIANEKCVNEIREILKQKNANNISFQYDEQTYEEIELNFSIKNKRFNFSCSKGILYENGSTILNYRKNAKVYHKSFNQSPSLFIMKKILTEI